MQSSDKWQRVCIEEVCEAISDCVNRTAPVVNGPTRYKMIRTTNVRDGWVNLSEVKYVTEDIYQRWTRREVPRKGDVILTREAPLGEVGMLRNNDTVFLGQRLVLYRTDPQKLDNRFLLYALQTSDLQGQIRSFGSGATVEHMRVPDAKKLMLDLPPLPTQRKIAAILSAYDDLIENNTRRIKILEEMAQALYREWFVNFRFPGHEQVQMVDSPLGPIPEGWSIKRLADFGQVVTGKTPSTKTHEYYGRSMPFIKTPDMHGNMFCIETGEYLSDLGAASQKTKTIPANSLCVSCIGTAGVVSITSKPSQTNQQINSIVLDDVTDRELLYFRLLDLRETINQYGANGATMVNLNKSKFESLRIICPDQETRLAFHNHVSAHFEQIKVMQLRNQNLRRTRDLLLPRLVSGELDVADLDIDLVEDAA